MSDISEETTADEGMVGELLGLIIWVVLAVLILRNFIFEPYRIPSPSMVPTLEDGDFIYVNKYSYGYGPKSFIFDIPVTSVINRIVGRDPGARLFGKMPQRGDIVVFRTTDPAEPGRVVIKRVVGLPGDKVEMRRGELYINDQRATLANRRPAASNSEPWLDTRNGLFFDETFPTLDGEPGHTHTITNLIAGGAADNFVAGNPLLPAVVKEGHLFMMGDNRDNSGDSRTSMLGQVPMSNVIGQAHFTIMSVNMPLIKDVLAGRTSPVRLLAVWDLFRWKRFTRPLI